MPISCRWCDGTGDGADGVKLCGSCLGTGKAHCKVCGRYAEHMLDDGTELCSDGCRRFHLIERHGANNPDASTSTDGWGGNGC